MIGNKNTDDFKLACCHCGTQLYLSQVAHRDSQDHIIGYIFLCDDCLPVVAGHYKVEIKPAE